MCSAFSIFLFLFLCVCLCDCLFVSQQVLVPMPTKIVVFLIMNTQRATYFVDDKLNCVEKEEKILGTLRELNEVRKGT